jgi:hypothetical protein
MRARLLSDEPDLAREQIEQILLVSRRNNEAAEITGALLFSDTNFSQVLAVQDQLRRFCWLRGDVRFWHLADVPLGLTNVCFWGQSGHGPTEYTA